MRAIIGFPSFLSSVASARSGTADGNYPVANALDKIRITNPWRSTNVGYDWVYLTFAAPVMVQAVFMVAHNLTAVSGAHWRLRLFASKTYDPTWSLPTVYDDTQEVWPEGSSDKASYYRSIRPILLQGPVYAGSLLLEMSTTDGVTMPELGALDVTGLWDLNGLSPGRTRGVDARSPNTVLAGGADLTPSTWTPRIFNGGVDSVSNLITETTGLDFQFTQDLVNPFVFASDVENPLSWARSCMLVRNQKMNPFVGASFRRDKVALSLIEHQR